MEASNSNVIKEKFSLSIPVNSKLPIAATVCWGVMLLTISYLCIFRISQIEEWRSLDVIYTTYPIVALTLLIFTAVFAKKAYKLILIPVAVMFLYQFIYSFYNHGGSLLKIIEVTRFFISWGWYASIFQSWYKSTFCLILLLVFSLRIFGVIKHRLPVLIVCFAFLSCTSYFIYDLYKFTLISDRELSSIIIELLLRFEIAFYPIGISFLTLALSNDTDRNSTGVSNRLYEPKSIGVCIFLTIITFGIYGLFWIYSICKNIKILSREETNSGGEYACLILVPFYILYWMYTRGNKVYVAAGNRGITVNNSGTLYLVLSLFGLNIIAYALIQNDLNTAAARATDSVANTTSVGQDNTILGSRQNATSPTEAIRELNTLKEQGIISEAEFEAKKKELLSRI